MAQLPDDEWVDDEQDWVDDSDFVDDKPTVESIQLSPEEVADSPSVLQSGLERYASPLTDFGRRSARSLRGDSQHPMLNVTDFMGSAFDEMTSPINAIPTALGLGASAPALSGIRRLLSAGSRLASAPTTAHGVSNMFHKDSTPMERIMGGVETVGGLFGMKGPKAKAPQLGGNLADSGIPVTEPNFKDLQKRVYELMDKDQAGTLTGSELAEAQIVNKKWRAHPEFGKDDVMQSLPDQTMPLDYSPTMEKRAKEIISSYGDTNFEGMTNKQIIEMAETIEPGWQSKTGKAITTPPELSSPNKPKVTGMKFDDEGNLVLQDGTTINPKTGKKVEYVSDPTGKAVKVETPAEPGLLSEVLNLPRALQASMDLSFPFRQGLGLIHHKGWWKAWPDMVKSFGSDKAFKGVMESIEQRPNFQKVALPEGGFKPSFAERSGLAITDNLTTREHEYIGNKFAELVPGVKQSNRAYLAFANKLRADVFDSLVDDFTKAGLDPRKNEDLAKELAAYVNNASGRGNLGALEKSANVLGQLYFSPRLLASRANMMGKGTTSLMREGYDLFKNPKAYVSSPPNVRKEYLKSMLALGSAWGTVAGLGAAAGASVSMDPTNSDFGKLKIGDTRIDPGGGFLQFAVLANRLARGESTSSTSGKTKQFADAKGPFDPTFASTVGNFNYSKSSPLARYIWDWASQKGNSFDATDQTARLFTPIIVQDLLEILNDPQAQPAELATLPLNAIGMGTQTYGAGRDYKRRMLGGLGQ